jgi:hypothetical protein
MAGLSEKDLVGLARKRRVRSLHRWFDVVKRSLAKPTLVDEHAPAIR